MRSPDSSFGRFPNREVPAVAPVVDPQYVRNTSLFRTLAICRISGSRKYACCSKNSPSSRVIKTCEYDLAHIATVASNSDDEREEIEEIEEAEEERGAPKDDVDDEEKDEKGEGEDDEEGKEEKAEANVGEEPKGEEIEEEEEDKIEEEEEEEEEAPLATKSENSFELLNTAHIVLTKEDPRETELIIELA